MEKKLELFEMEYFSRIKGFFMDQDCLRPCWNEDDKSVRFEELQHYTRTGVGGYDLKLYFDHKKQKYLAFVCGNNQKDHWFGDYITKKVFQILMKGVSPFEYLL